MVHKYYLLEVYGDIKYRVEKNGLVIGFPIAHHKFAPEKMVVIDNEDKKNKADMRYHRVQTEIVEFQWNELDKSAEGLLPIFEELQPLAQDMKGYFDGKDYTSDNYKKAQEYHTKFLELIKKYEAAVVPFRTAMDKKVAEQKEAEAKMYQKEGRMIAYNRMTIMNVAEEVLAEISAQKLNGANFTSGDASKFKALQEKLIKATNDYQTSIRDEKLLKMEGKKANDTHSFERFLDEANDFKAALVSLIERIETKKAVDEHTLRNSFFLENEDGTPENIVKQFNELVGEYNNSIR